MTGWRLGLVAGLTALLVALAVWQVLRERRISACLGAGGIWNGAASRCDAPRPGPILERDGLRRG
jgi:hypothetical protein